MTIDQYLDLLSPANRVKPRFTAVSESVISQVVDLLNLIESLPESFSLDHAVGPQLDVIGMLTGATRSYNVTDENFRMFLRSRIAMLHWDGTNETLPAALAIAFPGRTAVVNDHCDGTVSLSLSGDPPPYPLKDMFPIPAGIGVV